MKQVGPFNSGSVPSQLSVWVFDLEIFPRIMILSGP